MHGLMGPVGPGSCRGKNKQKEGEINKDVEIRDNF